ncbi:MAG: hypothetical protein L6V95_02070 [Candidatus Melainabacteria bacterium]|nr:MAG: hypothetical protein L6V95_02070 [Candidatus Melainabacteria bacterium]
MQFIDLEQEGVNKFEELKDKIDGKMDLTSVQANFIVYLLKKYNSKKFLNLEYLPVDQVCLFLTPLKMLKMLIFIPLTI